MTSYTYNAADELTQAGSVSYGYDQNGNETSAGGHTFAYDLANRLVSTTSGGSTTTYTYDGDGKRRQAITTSQTTNYLWDTTHPVPQIALERDGQNALVRRYVYGARRISMGTTSGTYYYHHDALGSVANITSSSGASQWTYAYEPFGGSQSSTQDDPGAPSNVMRFAGELLDATGLYHLRARQYDPALGRFAQIDPVDLATGSSVFVRRDSALSTYLYAAARPLVFVDPTGRTFEASDAALFAARLASSPETSTRTFASTGGQTRCTLKRDCAVFGFVGCRLVLDCPDSTLGIGEPIKMPTIGTREKSKKRGRNHTCECSCNIDGPKRCDAIKRPLRGNGGGRSIDAACGEAYEHLKEQISELMALHGIPPGTGCYPRHARRVRVDGQKVSGTQKCL